MFANTWKGEDKGGKQFGPTYINNFWIIDPFAAKILQESCFSNTHYSTHFYVKKKKKIEEGQARKINIY